MNEGDLIKIEFYGREMVYKVVSIDEKPVGIEDIMFNDNAATHKFFRNGNVVIRKANLEDVFKLLITKFQIEIVKNI